MRFTRKALLTVLLAVLAIGPVAAAPLASAGLTLTQAHPDSASPGRSAAKWLSLAGLAVFGAISIRDTGSIAKKFVTRASGASGDYKDGVTGAGARMESRAKESEGNYEQGVQAAIGRKAYGKGLNGAGAKYEKNATVLGPQRFQQGVTNAQDAYAAGVDPYLQRLRSLDLPPPGPRRSPQNKQRSSAVFDALAALKESRA